MTVDQVNYLNIALMVISALFAYRWPFETFLFAYGFFGPLHYLTEISWLHDRRYFTKRKYDYLVLVAGALVVTILSFGWFPGIPTSVGVAATITAFIAAFVFVITESVPARVVTIVLGALVGAKFSADTNMTNIFGVFLPTIIHVFIFTGMFILVGALRGRSLSGVLSLAVFVAIAAGFLLLHPAPTGYHASDYVKNNYGLATPKGNFSSGFMDLNYLLLTGLNMYDFGHTHPSIEEFIGWINTFLYTHPVALSLMAFIAFAYLYHYLNWFSKTSVIQWHNIPRPRFIAVIAVWVGSVALYIYDYSIGFQWLFFLSFSHVVLELPLNHITFINIGKEFRAIARTRRVTA
jgi:hypothetical protein